MKKTVVELWTEYDIGFKGKVAVRTLEEWQESNPGQKSWKPSGSAISKEYSRHNKVYSAIKKLSLHHGVAPLKAAQWFDAHRRELRKSLPGYKNRFETSWTDSLMELTVEQLDSKVQNIN
jgi:hypothetical protein